MAMFMTADRPSAIHGAGTAAERLRPMATTRPVRPAMSTNTFRLFISSTQASAGGRRKSGRERVVPGARLWAHASGARLKALAYEATPWLDIRRGVVPMLNFSDGLGAAQLPDPLHEIRRTLHHAPGAQAPRPPLSSVSAIHTAPVQRSSAGQFVAGQEVRQPLPPLGRVAAPAGGHYVAPRPIPAAHARLDMVHAQIFRGESFAAVHAAIPVPGKDLQPFHAFRSTCCTPHSFRISWISLIAAVANCSIS
jgi:hypothetical protein